MPCKTTSSFTEVRTPRASRSGTRGAVFLEAAVVISALTLGLLALVYVRDLYVRQLGAARLARAAVIAHSMAGCKANEPRDWLGADLADYTTRGAAQDQQPAIGKDNGSLATGTDSGKASNLLQRSGTTSSDGKGLLDAITDAEFGGEAKATRRGDGPLDRNHSAFTGRVRAKSFVSCGDEVKDGDFDRVLGVLKDDISSLLGK